MKRCVAQSCTKLHECRQWSFGGLLSGELAILTGAWTASLELGRSKRLKESMKLE
jgi:hypothetical protein